MTKPLYFGNIEAFEPKAERLPVVDQGIELAELLPENSEARKDLLSLTAKVYMASKSPIYIAQGLATADEIPKLRPEIFGLELRGQPSQPGREALMSIPDLDTRVVDVLVINNRRFVAAES